MRHRCVTVASALAWAGSAAMADASAASLAGDSPLCESSGPLLYAASRDE